MWAQVAREAVDSPAMETFKVRLERALSNLMQIKMSLPIAEECN